MTLKANNTPWPNQQQSGRADYSSSLNEQFASFEQMLQRSELVKVNPTCACGG
jgi:hypothetical protein